MANACHFFSLFPGPPGRPGPCDRTSSPTAPRSAAVPGPGPWCAWSAWKRRSQSSTRQLGSWARGIQGKFSWDFAGIWNFGGVILVELMDFWWFWWVESCWKQSNGWLHLVANLHIGWIWWHFFCWIQHSELWCTEVLLSVWSGVLMIVDWYFVWVSHNLALRFLWKPPWLPAFKVQGLP